METVVLVPGIGLCGNELLALAWRLRHDGFRTRIFWTNPWRGDLAAKARDLYRMLTVNHIESPAFVAHSFGGRVVMQLLNDYPRLSAGRVVVLGSPLSGCSAAERVLRLPGGRWIVGEAVTAAASQRHPALPAGIEIGSIAGRFNFLLGLFLCPGRSNDTIICVEETRHPDLAAHCVLFVSHTSMLFSAQVSARVTRFLRTGSFSPS